MELAQKVDLPDKRWGYGEENCNEKVKNVIENTVTIYDLSRLVYDKIVTKIR